MADLDIVALSPAGPARPSLAVAANRAGVRGLVDLEYEPDTNRAWDAVGQMIRFTRGPWGVKLGRDSAALLRRLLGEKPDRLRWVLLGGGDHAGLPDWVARCRQSGWQVLLEAVSGDEAELGQRLGVDGVVLKGHESGGRVGGESAFLLAQRCSTCLTVPFWVQGGIGTNTAAACLAVGAAGVVIDVQLLLTRESPLPAGLRGRLSACDGSETFCLGERLGQGYRFYSRPGLPAVDEVRRLEERLLGSSLTPEQRLEEWRRAVVQRVTGDPETGLWLIGQDAALAKTRSTVSAVVELIKDRSAKQVESARRLKPLAEGSPLAVKHGTRYPIVQGPMTRVSDTAAFADAVATAGGLPFQALALMRGGESERLLKETEARLGDKPWGAGILGFAPPEIRHEQLTAIKVTKPLFVLIAGGRPDQAQELEKDGIPTYLHVPSPGLLQLFLKNGSRKFVFEGRECGGHVGPRTSFVLWESLCEVLREHLSGEKKEGDGLQVLFAGGIHDARSAAMVSALAAGLAEQGVAVGVLMGTAYLFTKEAVESGAIVERFQKEALQCRETVLLESGPGHETRCVKTPYADLFEETRRKMQAAGRTPDEIRTALELLNVGRLRLASKGVERGKPPEGQWRDFVADSGKAGVEKMADLLDPRDVLSAVDVGSEGNGARRTPAVPLVKTSEEDQYARGMYMIGQAATLRHRVITMAELHADVSTESTRLLASASAPRPAETVISARPCDIAVVGMSCFFPGANDLRNYWANILDKVDAVTEVPDTHWDWRLFYNPDMKSVDTIYSKWGGFLGDVPFEPLQFGMPPSSLTVIEPLQLMVLEAARQALAHAGYNGLPAPRAKGAPRKILSPLDRDRERTAVILGIGGGATPLAFAYGFRSTLRLLATVPNFGMTSEEALILFKPVLPEWTEDSFPGMLANVAAGRVSNRFDFGGPNFAVDAACASSLCALQAGVRELVDGTSDVSLVMAADTIQTPFAFTAFSRTYALSPTGRCKTFDSAADGIALSEGVAALVLKRLADAERDGDRIYAVIKGVGSSSDGKDKGMTAPRPEGQMLALERAWGMAGLSPATAGLVEAHGTGTVVGDQTETQVLTRFLRESGAANDKSRALGSVKSMIGHSKCAAGLAGIIKSVLALHHKVLPPTLVQNPNPKLGLDDSPLFLNTEPLPWVHGHDEPRRAGVSAFGFGGTNFHVVLEEYTGDYLTALNGGGSDSGFPRWPSELLVWRKPNRAALLESLKQCQAALNGPEKPSLPDVAATLAKGLPTQGATLAIVASSLDDLKTKLATALTELAKPDAPKTWTDPRGLFFAEVTESAAPKIAFLFPGQGSQYPGMLGQVAMAFPEVRREFDRAELALADKFDRPLGRMVFPPAGTSEQERKAREELTRSEVAQPAIAAASLGMFRLLESLGVHPDFTAGHSFGEYVALCAAGALSEDDLPRLAHRRGRIIMDATANGGMIAVEASWEALAPLLKSLEGVCLANQNSPKQTVLSGTTAGIAAALDKFKAHGIRAQSIPVACPFHSPWIASAREPLAQALAECRFTAPRLPVFANLTAGRYPSEPESVPTMLTDHLTSPVRFQDEVVALLDAGARVFVEVGPQSVLTNLVNQTIGEGFPGQALALASDFKGRPGLTQLLHLLGQLVVNGVPVKLERLFAGRGCQALNPTTLKRETTPGAAKTYLVNSVRVKPEGAPEPPILGRMVPAPAGKPANPPAPAAPQTSQVMMPQLPQPPSVRPRNSDAAHVMALFQNLMGKFLDTQKSVMTTYLRGAPEGGSTPTPPVVSSMPAVRPPVPATNGTPADLKPQPAPAPVVAPTNCKPDVVDAEWLTGRLIDILSKRTGYPTEMLGPDVDLEAELGIDSIKHVEILGSLAEELHGDTSKLSLPEMEKLVGFKTVRGIVTYLADRAQQEPDVVAKLQAGTTNGHAPKPVAPAAIHRLLVATEPLPPAPPEPNLPRPAAGVLLITDDGKGLATALAERLDEQGQPAVILGSKDLTGADAIEASLNKIQKRDGPLVGVIHLLPLAGTDHLESLFLLARSVGRRLTPDQRGVALAVTATGGRFGVGDKEPSLSPGHGGIAGFLKSLAQEWTGALVRTVDLEPSAVDPKNVEATADLLLAELTDDEAPVEVGYVNGRRLTLACVPTPLGDAQGVKLTSESVVLVTGGARGITAAVALELARRHKPTLVLVGRSPLPEDEPTDIAGLTDPAKVKAALMDRLRQSSGQVAPAAVEGAYQRLLQDRDILANLKRMRDAGATVHYFSVDVRDGNAFRALLADVVKTFGGIDGVIHGAGVIADKLVKDKSPESFRKVFGTKVDSALTLADFLGLLPGSASKPHDRLKFVVFFTSVAGRFGNRGQADYAAANEVLSKLAVLIDSRMSTRAVAVAWGPWSGVGMASALEVHMTRAGVRMIGPDEGPELLAEELAHGTKGQCEVVLTGDVSTWMRRGAGRNESEMVQEGAK